LEYARSLGRADTRSLSIDAVCGFWILILTLSTTTGAVHGETQDDMTILSKMDEEEKHHQQDLADDAELKSLGYEAVLHRGLNEFSNFAFGFTEVAVLVSFTSQYSYGLQTGGNSIDSVESTSFT
jgi:hypothetical protein